MRVNLTIGDFSRMTHLSVKTLRHYHRVGLLEPASVDPDTGYRYYETDQIPTAQVIRRFRDLDMPVDQLRSVLQAPDPDSRNSLILAHLTQLEEQLQQTRSAVASLRALLTRPDTPISVEYRTVPATPALAISGTVASADLSAWWSAAHDELLGVLRSRGVEPAGPVSGLYANEVFEQELGDAVLYVPLRERPADAGRARAFEVPGVELAVTVHHGAHTDIDRTYGALGTHVAERAIAVDGPVREHYVVYRGDTPDTSRWRTEIGWPVFRTIGR